MQPPLNLLVWLGAQTCKPLHMSDDQVKYLGCRVSTPMFSTFLKMHCQAGKTTKEWRSE